MPVPIFLVDAFADGPFTGNPAGVCLLEAPADEGWMARVAGEMNQAETAFLVPREDAEFDLRWFTPAVEVDLCGHATLASAHVLWSTGTLASERDVRFHTKSGVLTAKPKGDWIELDFPSDPPVPATSPNGMLAALGSESAEVLRGRFDFLVAVSQAATVRELKPQFDSLGGIDARGVIVTASSDDPRFDFVSRFFAPRSGVPEDHATGSAHCTLAPYWMQRLGRNPMNAFQASPRGGWLQTEVAGDRVLLRGKAFTVLEGAIA